MKPIEPSELIITSQGCIYHIGIRPYECADTVILVGDPARVERISRHFDHVEHRSSHREITVHTGTYRGLRLSVISTGMGPDNIDIVLNELDALKNIDFSTRTVKPVHTSINIVRIGTSGALQSEIPVNGYVVSRYGLGLDGVLHFYKSESVRITDMEDEFIKQTRWNPLSARPYAVSCDESLYETLNSDMTVEGLTLTAVGFYGPQGRSLRLPLACSDMNDRIEKFSYRGMRVTNYEMETAAIYGLAKLLGHKACSINCVIANRPTGKFSASPIQAVDEMIEYTLERLTHIS